MKKIFLYLLTIFFVYANSDDKSSAEIKVKRLDEYMYYMDVDTGGQDFYAKIRDIIKKTIIDENPACCGFVVKTEKGVLKFKKFPPKNCNGKKGEKKGKGKKFKRFDAEMIAMEELKGGCAKSLHKLGMLIDKEIFKNHMKQVKRMKHKKDDD